MKHRLFVLVILLGTINVGVWALVLLASRAHPILLGLAAVSYGLGLRHAVDADHIAAIDTATRKLINTGGQPLAVGLFFSLGHSIVVITLSGLIVGAAVLVKNHLAAWQSTGSMIGLSVSVIFLLIMAAANFVLLFQNLRSWRSKKQTDKTGFGFISRLLSPLLNFVTASWHMLPIGFLFGLGFDTATEVGFLSISAVTAVSGAGAFSVLVLPLAFTAGMVLIDSLDGALMQSAYSWAYVEPARKVLYNIVITSMSAIIALFIGGIEALQILGRISNSSHGIFGLADRISLGRVGYGIILAFVAVWLIALTIYKLRRKRTWAALIKIYQKLF